MHFDNVIPSEIGLLNNLAALRITNVPIRGTIPNALFGLTQLNFLDLSGTYIHGTIATEIAMLSNLRHLVLSNRRISGSLPATTLVAHRPQFAPTERQSYRRHTFEQYWSAVEACLASD
jgi:Leucine-rich repeat (LRR) protein